MEVTKRVCDRCKNAEKQPTHRLHIHVGDSWGPCRSEPIEDPVDLCIGCAMYLLHRVLQQLTLEDRASWVESIKGGGNGI